MSVFVTIGRNLGKSSGSTGVPMSANDWANFKDLVRLTVSRYAGPVLADAQGWGHWEGVMEDTYMVLADSAAQVDALRLNLAVLAARFHQDVIALTVGDTQRVTAPALPVRAVEVAP